MFQTMHIPDEVLEQIIGRVNDVHTLTALSATNIQFHRVVKGIVKFLKFPHPEERHALHPENVKALADARLDFHGHARTCCACNECGLMFPISLEALLWTHYCNGGGALTAAATTRRMLLHWNPIPELQLEPSHLSVPSPMPRWYYLQGRPRPRAFPYIPFRSEDDRINDKG
jgi:hypothetical protein